MAMKGTIMKNLQVRITSFILGLLFCSAAFAQGVPVGPSSGVSVAYQSFICTTNGTQTSCPGSGAFTCTASGNNSICTVPATISGVTLIDAASITPTQINFWTTANVLKISTSDGNNCTSGNPTIGGQPIGKSGLWAGSPSSINNGQSISLQPCEAALIQILP